MEGNSLKFLSTQIGLGFKKPLMSPESLFVDINSTVEGIFGDSPIINPIPFIATDQRLLEIHVVEANSSDLRYALNIARGRIDLFLNAINDEADYESVHDELISLLKKVYKAIEGKVEIEWLGFINNYLLVTDLKKHSDKIIATDLLNINKGTPYSFAIRHANRFDICETLSNNQISISTGSIQIVGKEQENGLIIVQDFNTKPTPKTVDIGFVEKYVNESKNLIKINEIIALIS